MYEDKIESLMTKLMEQNVLVYWLFYEAVDFE
jgi:hypothetical protein